MSRKQNLKYGVPSPAYAQKEAIRFMRWLVTAPEEQVTLGLLLNRLKQLNPFIFESVLLECCKNYGYCIQSENKFTKDGGVDGKFSYQGRFYVIQAKLYKGDVCVEHIPMFQNAVGWQQASRGFFFHTGRASEEFWDAVRRADRVTVISGQRLVDFLLGSNPLFKPQT
ncbi:restriction endonuclease [Myxosarcina sp. GI1(2024)]